MTDTIVLFDMDGTLTEPREASNPKLLHTPLLKLINLGVHIGIITGSDENYLTEQMGSFLTQSSCRYYTHLLPCNGTKYYKPPQSSDDTYKLDYSVSMKERLGEKNYRILMQELILSQVDMSHEGLPLTGHFINARGSTINWCPIGRNANKEERELFTKVDAERGFRKRVIDELKAMLKQKNILNNLTIKFGGDTSFDIYPRGWDKTYGLRHFPKWNVWFVGDRCSPKGNDYEIYEACKINNQAYETKGPEETVVIIDKIVNRIQEKL